MDNYKIKVKDEAESKEAQELFFELGYEWRAGGKNYFKVGSGQILAYSTGFLFQIGNESGQELTLSELRVLALAKQTQDPALISGDVALANIHKCIVQYLHDDEPYGRWTTITDHLWSQYHLGMFLDPDTKFKFRLKPQTIKLELELPKPFEPKLGDLYWCVAMTNLRGYTQKVYKDDGDDECLIHLGAYRTEEEIKQVVEQLRKIRGTNS